MIHKIMMLQSPTFFSREMAGNRDGEVLYSSDDDAPLPPPAPALRTWVDYWREREKG